MASKKYIPCPECGEKMILVAIGRGLKFWGCYECSDDPANPVLYLQPITLMKMVMKLEPGLLIDLSLRDETNN